MMQTAASRSGTAPGPRVLHVTTVTASLRHFMAPFADLFREAGWGVDAAAAGTTGTGLEARYDAVFDVPWSRNPASPSNLSRALPQVRALLRARTYDVVHVMTPVAGFVTRMAVASLPRAARPAVVYAAHGFHFYRGNARAANAAYRLLERAASPWTDALCVVNDEDERAARDLRLAPEGRTVRLHGVGIDLERFAASAVSDADVRRVRADLGLSPADVLFTQVAEFTPRKRHADLLHALARVPGVHLALPGDGPLRGETEALARRLGVQDRTRFLGIRGDVPALLRASAAAVLVSEQEGLPTCVIEALALGVPVVGTDIRGTRDLLSRGGGWLVPLGDIEAIAGALQAVAGGAPPPRMPDMTPYGIDAVFHDYQRAYQVAMDRHRQTAA